MTKILIVEDEPAMLSGLADNLEFEGYTVATANTGKIGLQKIYEWSPELVLLDVMLPEVSGFDILKKIRKEGINTPVILLTARGEEMDKVRGLELGADDYITKPFSLRELLARVKANVRRASLADKNGDISEGITIGQLWVNFEKLEARQGDEPIKLSHKEFEILHLLYKKHNQIVTRDELLSYAWSDDYMPTSRTVDNFILRLRQKTDTADLQPIITVHGLGYKLIL